MKKGNLSAARHTITSVTHEGRAHAAIRCKEGDVPPKQILHKSNVASAVADNLLPPFLEEVRSDNELLAMAIEKGLVPVGLRAFFRIVEAWGLREDEGLSLLGFDHVPTESEIGIDPLKRISHILGIYRALHTLLPNPRAADGWVKKPNENPLFGGKAAIEYMLANGLGGIESVRKLLFGIMHT